MYPRLYNRVCSHCYSFVLRGTRSWGGTVESLRVCWRHPCSLLGSGSQVSYIVAVVEAERGAMAVDEAEKVEKAEKAEKVAVKMEVEEVAVKMEVEEGISSYIG